MGRGIRKPRTRRKCGDGAKQNTFFAKMVKTHHVLYQEKTRRSLIRLGRVSPDEKTCRKIAHGSFIQRQRWKTFLLIFSK